MYSEKTRRWGKRVPTLKEVAAICAWTAVWGAIFTLCIGVFGETIALFAVAATVLAASAVWYATHRRDKKKGRA
jgi:hypothetical protein